MLKYQLDLFSLIMHSILMTTLFSKADVIRKNFMLVILRAAKCFSEAFLPLYQQINVQSTSFPSTIL